MNKSTYLALKLSGFVLQFEKRLCFLLFFFVFLFFFFWLSMENSFTEAVYLEEKWIQPVSNWSALETTTKIIESNNMVKILWIYTCCWKHHYLEWPLRKGDYWWDLPLNFQWKLICFCCCIIIWKDHISHSLFCEEEQDSKFLFFF